MYRHKVNNPEHDYCDRTEVLKTDFRFQDRVDGVVGMTVEEVHVNSDSFMMLCRDKKNGKGMRVQVAKSNYMDRGIFLRLSVVEIIYKTEHEIDELRKKEEARIKRMKKKKEAQAQN